jgi:hypothetical protein
MRCRSTRSMSGSEAARCRSDPTCPPSLAPMAGTIEEVGAGVLDFAPGDEVYGCAGAPHGLPITHQQQLNADPLAFIKS